MGIWCVYIIEASPLSPNPRRGFGERVRVRGMIAKCRYLRKNQTDAEKKLWSVLRNSQLANVKFRRQHPIGKYIVDFYCPQYKLAIEVDGGQHYEDKGKSYDEIRTKELARYGINVLRFSDLDVLNNIEGVCEEILKACPSPLPSPHKKYLIFYGERE